MSVIALTLLFFALVVGWFLLAFVPALRELRNPVDARALPVAADGRVSPSYFADRFRVVLTERLAGPAQEVRASGQALVGTIDGEERFVVLPAQHQRIQVDADGSLDALVMAVGDLLVPEAVAVIREVYVEGTLRTEPDALLRASLAEAGIELGARTTSLRWLHSAGDLRTDRDCRIYGRASAARTLHLGPGTTFEKLHAARIEFGSLESSSGPGTTEELRDLRAEDLGNAAEQAGGRTRYSGDLVLAARSRFPGDLVVTGTLDVGDGCHLEGSVKARGVLLGEGVRIDGALISSAGIRAGARCRVGGPVLAEDGVELGSEWLVGSAESPSTLRGRRVDVRVGSVVFGTVWTLDGGGEVRA